MNKTFYIFLSIFIILFAIYLFQPIKGFPIPPHDSPQSQEPADTESVNRRAYFTDYDRQAVMNHYIEVFSYMPVQRFNYPPEEGQVIIRDQTRSSYLEELSQPFRQSLYVNGFVPSEMKDNIIINGRQHYQKITVRYVPSTRLDRILLLFFSFSSIIFVYYSFKNLISYVKN